MDIVFDFEVTGHKLADTAKVRVVTGEIRDFVRQRLRVLEAEIDKYNGIVVVNLTGSINGQIGITVDGNLPDDLWQKIKESITEQDMEHIHNKIVDML